MRLAISWSHRTCRTSYPFELLTSYRTNYYGGKSQQYAGSIGVVAQDERLLSRHRKAERKARLES